MSQTLEVFYDGDCPICRWEVDVYDRMDKADAIRWTAIEGLAETELPPGKTREDLLGRFHVNEIGLNESGAAHWHVGVDAFARIWKALPGLRRFSWLFSVPGLRQLTQAAYLGFLRWQRWHRAHRRT